MKRRFLKRGLTLVELLVSTTIVGIIAMGMVSIDYALRTNEQQQSRSALVSLRSSATLTDIIANARQAYGDVTTRCVQMAVDMTIDNTNYLCVYRDLNSPQTPMNFADDSWVCYTRRGTNLHKCTRTVAAGVGSCVAGDPVIGTVTTDVFSNGDAPLMQSAFGPPSTLFFRATIKNRYDPTVVGATYAATLAQEYITNPKILMSATVSPSGCNP